MIRRLFAAFLRWRAARLLSRGEAMRARAAELLDRADALERGE